MAKMLKQQRFNNILIIKPSSLGDVVRCLPILSGLGRRYSHARISWLVRTDCAAVLANNPHLDQIIDFDRRHYGKFGRSFAATRDFLSLLTQLRSRRFDLVLDLQGLFRSGFLSYCTAAPVRMGFADAREFAGCFYTHRVTMPKTAEHVVESYWRFAAALGFAHLDKEFALAGGPETCRIARQILRRCGVPEGRGTAALLVGGSVPAKRWPPDRYAALADLLHQRYHITVLLLGSGPAESALARRVVESAKTEVIDLVGKTSLEELIAIMQETEFCVGNDSGPLHIAAAMAVPVVGVYGPTDPAVVGPYGPRAIVVEAGRDLRRVGRYSKDPRHSIGNISVQAALEAVERVHRLCEEPTPCRSDKLGATS